MTNKQRKEVAFILTKMIKAIIALDAKIDNLEREIEQKQRSKNGIRRSSKSRRSGDC